MRKLFFAAIVALALFLSISNVSAANSTSVTTDQVINASSVVKSYVETNHTLPNTVNVGGNQVSMPQFLELSTTALLNINSNSNAPIALGNYNSAAAPSENITSRNITKTEYLDIANRVKSYIDFNGQAPNYATQTSTGDTIRFESMVYMYSKILNYYKTNNVLPNYVSVNAWSTISTTNSANVIGSTSYGYVEKKVYGNQSSNKTISLIIGVHPQENGIHTAIANALASKSASLTKRYVLYYVHVTQNTNDYEQGRMNGQLLAQQFVVPDVPKENPILAVDIHENHYKDSGYDYCRFLYLISNTAITKTYANQIISQMPFLVIYTPPNHTSPQYVTVPIANKGIPTMIYETYLSDTTAKKSSDANAFISSLDSKVGIASTGNTTQDTTAPKVSSTNPKNGSTGFSRTATVTIKFSENIKAGVNWSKIYMKNLNTGKTIVISKSISGNTLSIKMDLVRYAYNQYQIYIPASSVKDSSGNNLATAYTFRFKTGA
ncbi:Ig-like domain-containing protein [Methanobacterium sp.]|uniref:Ig-like domain-containing protein n=1 Tax=Methanobacterium sp. TaxID=2164 RepID=UPI003C714270